MVHRYTAALTRCPIELAQLLQSHRSIRKFKPDPIDPALVERVCHDAIVGGSSSGNLNSVSMVLTEDSVNKERLFELHSRQPMVRQAPLVVTFCADWYRTRQWLKARGARDNFKNLIGYHVAAFDAMILAQNVSLGFESEGLGICYMGTTLYSMEGISEVLELPDTCAPVTTIVAGYPDEDPPKRDRLPTQAFIHREKYRVPTSQELDAIYRQREVSGWERYMSMPRLRAEIERLGITSLAEFYTSKAKYDPDYFVEASERLRRFLESKGFL